MRLALQESLNAPAVWTAMTLGIDPVIRTARDMGFTSQIAPRPTLALGGLEVTPLELASAYATLANAGLRVPATAIRAVVDRRGAVTSPPREPARVIAAEEAFVVTDLLRTVMDEGTGAMARLLGVNAAMSGKTGSTNRDAWLVGYTPRLVTVVWIGFDEHDTLRLTGARGALPIWADFMRTATEVVPGGSFAAPSTVVFRDVDPTSGKLATPFCPLVRREPFLPSAVPTEICSEHQPHVGRPAPVVLAESR